MTVEPTTSATITLDAAPSDPHAGEAAAPREQHLVAELLVEEISIDGMCGVY